MSKLLKKDQKKIEFYDVMQKNIKSVYSNLDISFINNLKINNFDLIILANNHPKYVEVIEGKKELNLITEMKIRLFLIHGAC